MPELRQNPATKEWVIIAAERARRPNHQVKLKRNYIPQEGDECPFCPGHEHMTPPEILSYRTYETEPNSPGWRIRVIPNKYSALVPDGEPKRSKAQLFFPHMNGIGDHEVIIESPEHDKTIATMAPEQVEEIFRAYSQRYKELVKDPKYEMIIIFKNHGMNAGTSLRHPHSQVIATPITPMHIRHRVEEAMRYFDDNGDCVYCEMLKKEKKAKERVILETESYLCFSPYAARSPYEIWMMPKKHRSSFEDIPEEEIKELAYAMRRALLRIYRFLNDPDFNYIIFSAPCHEKDGEYSHWYIQIIPRISSVAGFELGSGIYINTVPPEKAAAELRQTPDE